MKPPDVNQVQEAAWRLAKSLDDQSLAHAIARLLEELCSNDARRHLNAAQSLLSATEPLTGRRHPTAARALLAGALASTINHTGNSRERRVALELIEPWLEG